MTTPKQSNENVDTFRSMILLLLVFHGESILKYKF